MRNFDFVVSFDIIFLNFERGFS